MATTAQAKKAADRKAARADAQETARTQAASDTALRKNTTEGEIVGTKTVTHNQEKPKPRISNAERKAQAKARAEAQAKVDAARRPPEMIMPKVRPGEQLSLHELNMRAKIISKQQRDVARDAANAAGKAAFEVLKGKKGSNPPLIDRHKNAARMQDQMQKSMQAAVAAAAAASK